MSGMSNKNVVVVGGSRGVGRAIAHAAHAQGATVLSVARRTRDLQDLALQLEGMLTLSLDATDERSPVEVFDKLRPDVLVLCCGAIPAIAPLQNQSWDQVSGNWNSEVKASFLFCRAALRLPLAPGTRIFLISSGAALGGSPLSGGYAGAKRMQMFIANYAQKESDRLGLGLRFLSVVPLRIMPQTDLGRTAVTGYSRFLGMSPEEFIKGMDSAQTPEDVARAVVELATTQAPYLSTAFTVSATGVEPSK
jgi:NAD(P)-dependent dehydrogenase (short-subunit alcohol dehydrogenase family)